MLQWFKRIEDWITDKLWAEDLRTAAPLRGLIISAARISVYAYRSFRENVVGIQAAGLTMFTVLGLFPLLWLAFFVAKMLAFSDRLMTELDAFLGQRVPANLQSVVDTLEGLIEHANRQDLELWGAFLLVYTGYALFTKVEEAFNHVWKATSRSWYTRLGSFVGLVVIVPVLMLAAFVGASFLPEIWVVKFGLRWAPLLVLWIALTLLYKAMPSAGGHRRSSARRSHRLRWAPCICSTSTLSLAWPSTTRSMPLWP